MFENVAETRRRKFLKQINIHDVKNQKKEMIAEIAIFRCLSGEIQPSSFCFKKKWLENVTFQLESLAWRIIRRLESEQTQRNIADAVGVARSVFARLWIWFQ